MSTTGNSIFGHCLCQAVAFSFEDCQWDEVGQVCICHCAMCRHAIGMTAPVAMALPSAKLNFLVHKEGDKDGGRTTTKQPPTSLKEYRSSKNTRRFFCGTCGSSILFAYDEEPNTIWVYVSTFDDAIQLDPALRKVLADPKISCHIFSTDKAGWYDLYNPRALPVGDQLELWRMDSCKPKNSNSNKE